MIGRIGNAVSRLVGAPAPVGGPGGTLMPVPRTQAQWNGLFGTLFGPPGGRVDPTHDRAVSQVYGGPYQGPLDLDRYGGETPRQRREYREEHSRNPVFRAAINGQRDDIAVLEPSITSGNKKNPVANDAAEFVKWSIAAAPGGWPGLINNIYIHGSIDGFSVLELKQKVQAWNGVNKWGFAYARPLDTTHIRLRLDQYFNVIDVVNMVRGLESYSVTDYLIYTHNGLYNSPFGQSDGRAAITAAKMISDVYKLWYVALKVYGLPYMVGKTAAQNRALMATTLEALRAGGYAVLTSEKDSIDAINLAAGAALNGFEQFIHTKREDIFFAVRNVAQPFMEGDGGADAHTDTGKQQDSSNAGEKFKAHNVVEVVKSQLIPWLIRPNFDLDESEYPLCKLGGTDWNQNAKIIATIREASEAGLDPSKKWAQAQIAMEGATDDEDRLASPQERMQQQQAQQQTTQPGGETDAGEDDPTGVQDEATAAALDALGVPTDDGTEPETFAEGHHREGEVWKSREGRWMTIKGGRAVPAKDPGAAAAPLPDRKPTKPGAGATKPKPGTRGYPTATPVRPTPDEDEASRVAWEKVPEPKKVAGAKRVAVKASSPEGKAMLARADQWADAQAAKHAARVAKHLGIDERSARFVLANAIKMLCRQALKTGADAGQSVTGASGRTLNIGVKRKSFSDATANAVVWLATARLAADPARFQFRRGHDAADGTVRDLPAERFDPSKRPPLLVWQDDDGELYVIDGHHRLAWAERDGVSRVPVRVIDADTAEEAREIGRLANQDSAAARTFSDAHRLEPDAARWTEELIAEFAAGSAA